MIAAAYKKVFYFSMRGASGGWAGIESCCRRRPASHQTQRQLAPSHRTAESSEEVAMVVDPVCKMEVEDTEAEQGVEFQGTTYFFCSPVCKEAFEREPARYAGAVDKTLDPEAAA